MCALNTLTCVRILFVSHFIVKLLFKVRNLLSVSVCVCVSVVHVHECVCPILPTSICACTYMCAKSC